MATCRYYFLPSIGPRPRAFQFLSEPDPQRSSHRSLSMLAVRNATPMPGLGPCLVPLRNPPWRVVEDGPVGRSKDGYRSSIREQGSLIERDSQIDCASANRHRAPRARSEEHDRSSEVVRVSARATPRSTPSFRAPKAVRRLSDYLRAGISITLLSSILILCCSFCFLCSS